MTIRKSKTFSGNLFEFQYKFLFSKFVIAIINKSLFQKAILKLDISFTLSQTLINLNLISIKVEHLRNKINVILGNVQIKFQQMSRQQF